MLKPKRLVFNKEDRVALADEASLEHGAVESHFAVELADDSPEYIPILAQSVGIKGRHDATPPQLRCMDEAAADLEAAPRPLTLHQTFNTADDDVRPQAPAVEPHVVYRAVGGHQKR